MDDTRTPVPGTLLGVWAHPDDEAYLSAGLMALTRDAGHRVVVATATAGERGTDDPDHWPPRRLARLRRRELRGSLRAVGVLEHTWLGYRDGVLATLDPERGVADVVRLLHDVRPHTVVTFGPEGMTGHEDHRTVSGRVTEAWRRTGRTSRLWYATLTPEFHATWGDLNEAVGLWADPASVPVTPRERLAAHVLLADDVLERKVAALRAHRSQTQPLAALVGPDRYRAWWSSEYFVAA